MGQDILVRCEAVSKKFCRDLRKSLWYGIRDSAAEFKRTSNGHVHRLRSGEFWANKDIGFELKRGECLGLVGRNGAGKTTLLKMLNGLIKPDAGVIEITGHTGALIALGAGFNPILTGRENVLVNGAILGLSKRQIQDRLDTIVEFAALEEAIDAPIQSYSSGMRVRLGFAIAAILLEPDVLLLDEVLAVGDAAFRHKCYARMSQLMSSAAVILVSHSMEFIAQCCTAVGMMTQGRLTWHADPIDGISAYNLANCDVGAPASATPRPSLLKPITAAAVQLHPDGQVPYGGTLTVTADITSECDLEDLELFLTAIDVSERPVMVWSSVRSGLDVALRAGTQRLTISIDQLVLHDGKYKWNFFLGRRQSIERYVWIAPGGEFTVSSAMRPLGNAPYLPSSATLEVTYGN